MIAHHPETDCEGSDTTMLKNRFTACFSVIFGAVLRALAVPLSVSLSLLLVLASATSCHLIAQAALRAGVKPWSKP